MIEQAIQQRHTRQRREDSGWLLISLLAHGLAVLALIFFTPLHTVFFEEPEPDKVASTLSSDEIQEVAEHLEKLSEEQIRRNVQEQEEILKAFQDIEETKRKEYEQFATDQAKRAEAEALDAMREAAEAMKKATEKIEANDAAEANNEQLAAQDAQERAADRIGLSQFDVAEAKAAHDKARNEHDTAMEQHRQANSARAQAAAAQRSLDRLRSEVSKAERNQAVAEERQKTAEAKIEPAEQAVAGAEQANAEAQNQSLDRIKRSAQQRLDRAKSLLERDKNAAENLAKQADAAKAATDAAREAVKAAEVKVAEAEAQAAAKLADAARAQRDAAAAQKEAITKLAAAAQAKADAMAADAADSDAADSDASESSDSKAADADTAASDSLADKSVPELYEAGKALEDKIAETYKSLKAMDVAMIRDVPLDKAMEAVDVAKADRPELDAAVLTSPARTGSQLEARKEALATAERETSSMVAAGNMLLMQAAAQASAQSDGREVSFADTAARIEHERAMASKASHANSGRVADMSPMMKPSENSGPEGASKPSEQQQREGEGEGDGQGEKQDHQNKAGTQQLARDPSETLTPPQIEQRVKPAAIQRIGQPGEGLAEGWVAVTSWYIMGPYDNPGRIHRDYVFLPETAVDLDAVYSGRGKHGKDLRWEYTVSGAPNGIVEPRDVQAYAVYYAYREIEVDQAGDYWVAMGSDDKGKVWINDQLIWVSSNEHKGWRSGEALRKVHFKQGRNRILFRCENGHLGMGFSFMIWVGSEQPTSTE